MTAPVLDLHHPDDETLAAFVDDRASAETREKVIEHMAACADCRDVVVMSTEIAAEEANVVPHRRSAGRWIAPLAAAAAIGGALLFIPDVRYKLFGVSPDAVMQAAASMEQRHTPGRIAGGFPYKELKEPTRGAPDSRERPTDDFHPKDDLPSRAKVYELASANEESRRPSPHAQALAALLVARDGPQFSEAVALFEKALAKADPKSRDRVNIDFTAALLARGKWNSDDGDLLRALTISEEVWARTKAPEALWNRASALELLRRDQDARAAWQAYLAVDASSPWATEAREKLQTEP